MTGRKQARPRRVRVARGVMDWRARDFQGVRGGEKRGGGRGETPREGGRDLFVGGEWAAQKWGEGEEGGEDGDAEEDRGGAAGFDGVGGKATGGGEEPVVQRRFGVGHADEKIVAVGEDELGPAGVGGFVSEGGEVAEVWEARGE